MSTVTASSTRMQTQRLLSQPQAELSGRDKKPSRSGTRAFTWVDTETGELHHTHPSGFFEMCGCETPHDGIPCLIDRLISNKVYRPKYQRMIQHDQGPYLLAAAQYVLDGHAEGEIPQPERYFATMCSWVRWQKLTKPEIIRRGGQKRYELRSDQAAKDVTAERRFRAKVDWQTNPEACDLWTKAVDNDGYGRFYVGGKEVRAHRWWYEHHYGPIPDGYDIDHTCGIRRCMKHLAAKPHDINRGRTQNPGEAESQRTRTINEAVRDTKASRACIVPMCDEDVIGFLVVKGKLVNICAEHRATYPQYEFVSRKGPASQASRRTGRVVNISDEPEFLDGLGASGEEAPPPGEALRTLVQEVIYIS